MNRMALTLVAVLVAWSPLGLADEETPGGGAARGEAREAVRKALSEAGDFPWYDAARDDVQRIDVAPPRDLAARKSKWEPPNVTWQWPAWLIRLFEVLGWFLFGAVVVLLIYLLSRAAVSSGWLGEPATPLDDEVRHGDADRIEALPFQFRLEQGDLLARARHHYEAGDFSQAIIYLYSYQLIQLDRHQLIRLTRGKTNRQYLRELRSREGLWEILKRSVVLFEDVFFGRHPLDRERFESCWRGLDQFHHYLSQVTP